MANLSELSQETLLKILTAVQDIVSARGDITAEEFSALVKKITKRNR
jgi:hypothetical protein